jgi:hypothetical protein
MMLQDGADYIRAFLIVVFIDIHFAFFIRLSSFTPPVL